MYRSFAKPPVQVQTVCECIVILRGYKEINWKTAKGMMAETNFLNSLQNMDVDGILQGQVLLLQECTYFCASGESACETRCLGEVQV